MTDVDGGIGHDVGPTEASAESCVLGPDGQPVSVVMPAKNESGTSIKPARVKGTAVACGFAQVTIRPS